VELGASIPVSGGPYAFCRRAFGPLVGFLTGWIDWVAQTATASFIAIVFAECIHRLSYLHQIPLSLIAIAMIGSLTVLHLLGTRTGGWSQSIGSAIKAMILIVIVCALFHAAGQEALTFERPTSIFAAFIALRAIYATYGGWNSAAYFCEEVNNPGRSLPRAIFTGLAVVTILYVLFNAALLHVLSPAALANSTLPVADAASLVFGPRGAWLVVATAAIIVVTVGNTQLMYAPRILHSMARDGFMPASIAFVSRTGVPAASLLLTALVAITLASTGVYERLIAIYAPLSLATNALVNLAALRMRAKYPQLERPFRMPLFPLPSLLALSINVALATGFIVQDFTNARLSLLLLLPAIPIFLWSRR
jgi:APA family basic amino acid/polyamine antiporter